VHAARSPTGLHGTRAAAIASAPLANDLAAQTRRANSHQNPVSALFFLKRFGLMRGTFFAFRVGRPAPGTGVARRTKKMRCAP